MDVDVLQFISIKSWNDVITGDENIFCYSNYEAYDALAFYNNKRYFALISATHFDGPHSTQQQN
jgi:hypothetical protein